MRRIRLLLVLAISLCVAAATAWSLAGDRTPQDPALERTRKTVHMLDDLYKTAVVLITEHYVEESSDLPAGSAFKALFAAMKEKGWHEVRLVDATGHPTVEENAPADDFETAAIRELKGGQDYFEQVEERNGERYLRAATSIPVVLEKCTLCHEHYKQAKPGEAIGAMSYTIRVE